MKFHPFIFLILFSFIYGQELELPGRLEQYADWESESCPVHSPRIVQNNLIESIVIEYFRNGFCTQIMRSVPKDQLFINNRFFSINKNAAARFSWDICSYAFIQATNGKEFNQVWYPAFSQVFTNSAACQVAYKLERILPKNEHSQSKCAEFAKDQVRLALAQTMVGMTKSYFFPIVTHHSLAFFKVIFPHLFKLRKCS